MKTITRVAVGLLATITLASASSLASSESKPIYLSITSPNHPDTWVAGASQKAKVLRWDSSRQMLVADVKYSTAAYADTDYPAMTDDHTLAFPNVRLARNGIDLLATNHSGETAKIGSIKNGFFGKEIVLKKDVNFNVHRIDGKIYASLVCNGSAQN